MKTPIYKSYEDLPLYLNAETISKALGIAISSAYELMQEKDFPTFKVSCIFPLILTKTHTTL